MAFPRGVKKFVAENSVNIAPEFKENALNYSNACIYFKEKSIGKCLESLLTVDLSKWYKTNIYKLRLCCYYEQSHFESVLAEIDSFEHYLRMNKDVSELMRKGNFDFVRGMKKLIKIKHGKCKDPDFEIKELLKLTQNSLWGYWFKEKMDDFETGHTKKVSGSGKTYK
ncbi:MAG: hypothetical protein IPL53_24185 [Ignavibacteria bacterium]|nr:hypothetical protein [Ignavibacteria bacterium]